jgi:hypothetical protein
VKTNVQARIKSLRPQRSHLQSGAIAGLTLLVPMSALAALLIVAGDQGLRAEAAKNA